jgi:class 3 adenylate cyclase
VDVVASQATMEQAGAGDFVWQELDRVRVRGRRQAELVYTVHGPAGDATPQRDH